MDGVIEGNILGTESQIGTLAALVETKNTMHDLKEKILAGQGFRDSSDISFTLSKGEIRSVEGRICYPGNIFLPCNLFGENYLSLEELDAIAVVIADQTHSPGHNDNPTFPEEIFLSYRSKIQQLGLAFNFNRDENGSLLVEEVDEGLIISVNMETVGDAIPYKMGEKFEIGKIGVYSDSARIDLNGMSEDYAEDIGNFIGQFHAKAEIVVVADEKYISIPVEEHLYPGEAFSRKRRLINALNIKRNSSEEYCVVGMKDNAESERSPSLSKTYRRVVTLNKLLEIGHKNRQLLDKTWYLTNKMPAQVNGHYPRNQITQTIMNVPEGLTAVLAPYVVIIDETGAPEIVAFHHNSVILRPTSQSGENFPTRWETIDRSGNGELPKGSRVLIQVFSNETIGAEVA